MDEPWQEASGDPAGFPYHTLLGLTIEAAEAVIDQVARRLGWNLVVTPRVLADELRLESQVTAQDTFVFPPYLQILLSAMAAEPRTLPVDASFIQRLGGLKGIIATYLRRVVDELESRGGDFQYVRHVLQAVCRSSGDKLRQSAVEIAEYAGISVPTVHVLLSELVRNRLVRPLGDETFEIQHDRLAEVIVSELRPEEKEAKQAAELLLSKSASFEATKALLTQGELHLLFRYQTKLPAKPATHRLLITSVLEAYHQTSWPPVGWVWFRAKTLPQILQYLIEAKFVARLEPRKTLNRALAKSEITDLELLVRIAAKNIGNLRDGALAALESFTVDSGSEQKLRKLLKHENEKLRRATAVALRDSSDRRTRNALRTLALKDKSSTVRRAAMDCFRETCTAVDIEALELIARTKKGEQARQAVAILGANLSSASRRALKSLIPGTPVRTSAARLLLRHPTHTTAITAQILRSDDWRLKALLAEESRSLEILALLAGDRAATVRDAAVNSIALLRTQAAYDWLTSQLEAAETTRQAAILNAIAKSGHRSALDFLVSVAESDRSCANEAIDAITKVGDVEAVNYLLAQSNSWTPDGDDEDEDDDDTDVDIEPDEYNVFAQKPVQPKRKQNPWHRDVVNAIKAISDRSALPELRGWSQSPVRDIAIAAIGKYAQISEAKDRGWMFSLLPAADDRTKALILSALIGTVLEGAKPLLTTFAAENVHYAYFAWCGELEQFIASQTDRRAIVALRELCAKSRGLLRDYSLSALAKFSDPEDLPVLIEAASSTEDEAHLSAIKSLVHFDDARARETLRQLTLHADRYHLQAATAFCRIASESEKRRLLAECVEQGKFNVAGIIDFDLHAPIWWQTA